MTRTQEDLSGWTTRERPPREPIEGRFVRVEPFEIDRHASDLFEAYRLDTQGALWDYLPYGPFADLGSYEAHVRKVMASDDPFFHAIIDLATGKSVGVASLMRIVPEYGVIEVGHICYSPLLQRTPGATEAQYLLARRVFDELGYRRYEWKCDNANAPSRRAAERLGFSFEGIFRKHLVVKGKNRDTAWFAPAVKDECRVPVDGRLVVTRSDDGGQSLSVQSQGLPGDNAYDLIYRHALVCDGTGEVLAMGSTTGNLYLSADAGATWRQIAGHLPPIAQVAFG